MREEIPPAERQTYIIDTSVVLKWYYQEEEKEVEQAFNGSSRFGFRSFTFGAPAD
jgi:predicted nucleic acid-binding protein